MSQSKCPLPAHGIGIYASGRDIASVVRGAETVGGVDAVAVEFVRHAKTLSSANAARHGISTMVAVQRRAGAQRRGTSVTQPSKGATERKLVSSIAIGAGRTRQCGSMSAD